MVQDYVRAKTKDEVVAYLQKGYTILGGGNYLSQHQDQIVNLVDIQSIGLNKIFIEDQKLVIESGTTFTDIVKNSFVPKSFKEAINQELKPNYKNTATIGGYISVNNRFSNILAWLNCSNAQINYYPEETDGNLSFESFLIQKPENTLIDRIVFPRETNIVWRMISRTPDDFPLISIFMNFTEYPTRITILGFSDRVISITTNSNTNVIKETLNYLNISCSQYNNPFISFNYFFKMTSEILDDLTSRGV